MTKITNKKKVNNKDKGETVVITHMVYTNNDDS